MARSSGCCWKVCCQSEYSEVGARKIREKKFVSNSRPLHMRAIPSRGQLEPRNPQPLLPSAAIGQIWGGGYSEIPLRYRKNIGAIGIAVPYGAIGGVEQLGYLVNQDLCGLVEGSLVACAQWHKQELPAASCSLPLPLFENPYRTPRPTESQNPPSNKK